MKVRTLIPNIRFRGFSDPWEQRKLQQIAKVFDGTHQTPEYVSNGVPFVSVENIKTLKTNKYISNNAFQNNFKIFPQKGDIFMTRIGNIGSVNIVENNKDLAYYVSLALIRPEHIRTQYLAQYISSQNGQRQLWRRTLHVAFPKKINKNEISKINIFYPDNVEQEKIGSLIIKLDHLIAANEDKVQQLKTLKKLMMQKIFSQEWRFKGFTDPWEQRKFFDNIKQVLDYRGKTPKKLNMKWNEEPKGYLALSAINVKAGYIDKHIETYYASEKLYKKWMGKDSLSAGDILFTTEAPMGNVALVPDKGKYILSQRTIAFKLDNLFWLEFLESTIFKSKAVAISSGGTAQGVSQKSLRQVIVIIPSDVNEQKRIGQVLVTVDNLIAANEDKLNQLKRLKKYLMQNLFV
ncbi:restriction endonuclease subunit S [Lactiplantibacillus plantarum]|uniref:restriction endonuclease subunit S n=1 Tax=Lactiplantibacillus plantarum TaxID=1590 RepID=UPI00325E8211